VNDLENKIGECTHKTKLQNSYLKKKPKTANINTNGVVNITIDKRNSNSKYNPTVLFNTRPNCFSKPIQSFS